ncbi:MAG: sulfatase-like hydrolase/transferase, partial [Bacteroidota bacterium]
MSFRLLSGLILSVLFLACQSPPPAPPSPPNIVLVFTDDQGYQDLGCFGSPDILTPNLDKVAQNGVKFSRFYVAQPVCSASRAALMTGCYPSRIGIQGALFPKAPIGLNPEEETIAEILKANGYATAAFGKWHVGDHPDFSPLKQGFDQYFGIPYSNDMWPLHPNQENFQFVPLPLIEQDSVLTYLEDQSQLTTQLTERAVSFIESHQADPFFLYLAHPQPHVPLFVSEKFKGSSARGLYGDVIAEIDWSVGEIMKTLEKSGQLENTLFIYT